MRSVEGPLERRCTPTPRRAVRFDSTNLLRQMAAAREAGAPADPGPSERSTSEMRPRLHSFGGAGAFHCAPSELRAPAPVDARPFGG